MNHKYLYLLLLFLIVSCQRNVETEPPVLKEMCQRLFFTEKHLSDGKTTAIIHLTTNRDGCIKYLIRSERILLWDRVIPHYHL